MTVPWPAGDPRTVVREILAAPSFARPAARGPAPADPLLALLQWCADRIGAVFAAIGHLLGATPMIAPFVGALVALAVAAAVVVVAFKLVGRWVRATPRAVSPLRAVRIDRRDAGFWLARALDAMREDRLRDAAAAFVQAAFVMFDRAGRLPYDAARTPSEARRVLGEPAFDAFARDAELALFARDGAQRTRIERMRAALDTLGPP